MNLLTPLAVSHAHGKTYHGNRSRILQNAQDIPYCWKFELQGDIEL